MVDPCAASYRVFLWRPAPLKAACQPVAIHYPPVAGKESVAPFHGGERIGSTHAQGFGRTPQIDVQVTLCQTIRDVEGRRRTVQLCREAIRVVINGIGN